MSAATRPAAVLVACELTGQADLDDLLRCLVSVWSAGGAAARVVIPFGESRAQLVDMVGAAAGELDIALDARWIGEPRVRAVNAGLRLAIDNECDAVLLDPGVELTARGWVEALRARTDAAGRPAAVVGGRLLDSRGNVHRAGYWFSRLTRAWSARLEHAPADLVQVERPCRCPVPDAFSLVRYEAIQAAGLYDEALLPPLDAIDFCLRVYRAGLECIYEPAATAVCLSPRRVTAPPAAQAAFDFKWHGTDLSPWVPPSL